MKILNYFKTLFGIKPKNQKTCCNNGICLCKKTEDFNPWSINEMPASELTKGELVKELPKEENILQETPRKKRPYRKYASKKKKESTKEKVEAPKKENTSPKPKKRKYAKRKPKSDNNTQTNQN
jgi:hypothetical protein